MKKYAFIGIFLAVFIGTALLQYKNSLPVKNAAIKPVISLITVKQTISVDGDKKSLTSQVKKGMTALQALSSISKIKTKGSGENAYIEQINERTALETNKEFWAFYVNGKQAEAGAGSYVIKNNDTIEWKIETY